MAAECSKPSSTPVCIPEYTSPNGIGVALQPIAFNVAM